MPLRNYAGLCLGGPQAGMMLEHTHPQYEMRKKLVIVGQQPYSYYHYVPLMGLRGFWLWEEETKGTGPWDDIIRVLCDHYVLTHMPKT